MAVARPWLCAARAAASAAALAMLQGCSSIAVVPAGPVAIAERTILLNSLAIMLAIVVPTVLATLGIAWWFRSSNTRARYLPDFSYSGEVEFITWAIPALVILFLGGIAWIGSHDLDPAKPLRPGTQPLPVQVVSLDWKWLFIYPQQGVATINYAVIPVGVPVQFQTTSATVFNVFFVPELGSEIYTMNGMATQVNLMADHPGDYPGLSAHFSGDGFSNMHFDVKAVPLAQFGEWLRQTQSAGSTLDDAAYRDLLRQGVMPQPVSYRTVRPYLFNDIVEQKLPPGYGPHAGKPNPAVIPEGNR